MATLIPCSVDTTPMAKEIQSVSDHVQGTTAAVVAMQSAVIAAEHSGANKVCSNVNRGFFTLMQSQISQKIAHKQSRVEALIMRMAQQKRLLLGVKANMEKEYGRISARYLKIFTSINKELEQRVYQIDQPVFELVNKHMLTASNRINALSSWVVTSQLEGIAQSQQLVVSKMKSNAQKALAQSTDFLSQINEQRVLTSKVLLSNPKGNNDQIYQIPIAICETQNDLSGIPRTEISIPSELSAIHANQIRHAIRTSADLEWTRTEKPQQLSEEFASLVEGAQLSPRIKEMMMKMYSSEDFETL